MNNHPKDEILFGKDIADEIGMETWETYAVLKFFGIEKVGGSYRIVRKLCNKVKKLQGLYSSNS